MGSKLVILLFASVLAALMLAAEGDHDSPQQLSYSDVLLVLSELSAPYHNMKAFRSQQINQQVDNIVSQIRSVTAALATLHQLVHNINRNMPLLATNIHLPLLGVKYTLKEVIGHLASCYPTPKVGPQTTHIPHQTATIGPDTPSTPGSSQSSSSSSSSSSSEEEEEEEVQEHHQSALESLEHAARPLRLTADHFLDAIRGVTSDGVQLDAVLHRYETNSVVSLNDTARAFLSMAHRFGHYRQRRFVNLMSKIREVKDAVDNFNQHVTHITSEVTYMNDHAAIFYSTSTACIDELTNLTITVRDLTGRVC